MTFSHPFRFAIALFIALALALLYNNLLRRKTTHDLAYSSLAFWLGAVRPRRWIIGLLDASWVAALFALAFATGGVHLTAPMPVRDGAVFICIDTSGSMATTDVSPTRAAAALDAARAFIEESAPGTRIGLISFSGGASMIQPLTPDRSQVVGALTQVPPPNGATAIGDALRLAGSALPRAGHRLIVLITDGVNNTGVDPQEVAEWLGEQHVPIYTVGIGTPSGGLIPGSEDEATIDEGALQEYAQVSGGAYARAENATQLHDALARLGRITGFANQRVDATEGFTIIGVVLLVGTFLASLGLGKV